MGCGAFAAHHKVDHARLSVSESGPTGGRLLRGSKKPLRAFILKKSIKLLKKIERLLRATLWV